MAITVQTFTKWAIGIQDKETDKTGVKHIAKIVPSLFCATRYANEARYCVEDRTLLEERRLQPRQKNVVFKHILHLDVPRDIVVQKIIRLRALQNVSVGLKVCADYGAAYMFPQ